MPLNHLTIPEMVTSTETWVEPGHAVHEAFMAVPSLAGLMPKIESTHGGLLGVQRVTLELSSAELGDARAGYQVRSSTAPEYPFRATYNGYAKSR